MLYVLRCVRVCCPFVLFVSRPQSVLWLVAINCANTRPLAFPRNRALFTWSPGSPGSRVVRSNSAACAFKTYYANTINVRAHSLAQPRTLFLRLLAYYCAVALASSSLFTSPVRASTHCVRWLLIRPRAQPPCTAARRMTGQGRLSGWCRVRPCGTFLKARTPSSCERVASTA